MQNPMGMFGKLSGGFNFKKNFDTNQMSNGMLGNFNFGGKQMYGANTPSYMQPFNSQMSGSYQMPQQQFYPQAQGYNQMPQQQFYPQQFYPQQMPQQQFYPQQMPQQPFTGGSITPLSPEISSPEVGGTNYEDSFSPREMYSNAMLIRLPFQRAAGRFLR